jgi:hypothetical protein
MNEAEATTLFVGMYYVCSMYCLLACDLLVNYCYWVTHEKGGSISTNNLLLEVNSLRLTHQYTNMKTVFVTSLLVASAVAFAPSPVAKVRI